MAGYVSNLFRFVGQSMQVVINNRQFHALPTTACKDSVSIPALKNPWSLDCVRTIIRNRFPKANERKRVKTHGWRAHLSTKNGRRTIMRRILKGRFVLTH